MKIVKFSDGKYALRKFSLFYLGYAYSDPAGFWWTKWDGYFTDCRVDYATAVKMLDEGTPV